MYLDLANSSPSSRRLQWPTVMIVGSTLTLGKRGPNATTGGGHERERRQERGTRKRCRRR
jgi:hypothetical protein